MALSNSKLTITGETVINDAKIVGFGAMIDLESGEMRMFENKFDHEAIKQNREVVRDDRGAFEDFAYAVHDEVKRILDIGATEAEAVAENA